MSTLGIGQKPVVMNHYPHMMPEDTEVWSEFLSAHGQDILEVWYDVHVGTPVMVADEDDELAQKVAAGISRKRIDVVARVPGGYWVIEVKPFCSHFAFGQIMLYLDLFTKEFSPAGEVWPVVVCRLVDEDVVPLLDRVGVVAFEV